MSMLWQDWVFAIGSWLFIISFIPSFLKREYPAIATSVLTGVVLLAFSVTYFSLKLPLASISNLLTAGCWFAMAVLKLREKKRT